MVKHQELLKKGKAEVQIVMTHYGSPYNQITCCAACSFRFQRSSGQHFDVLVLVMIS